MTATTYEIDRVHDMFIPTLSPKAVSTERCDSDTCTFSHFYSVYERSQAEPKTATWVTDFETLEDAQEAIDNDHFHLCDDECRSNGCTERHK